MRQDRRVGTVAPHIGDHHAVSVCREVLREVVITLFVLLHAVYDLYHRFGFRGLEDRQRQSVTFTV